MVYRMMLKKGAKTILLKDLRFVLILNISFKALRVTIPPLQTTPVIREGIQNRKDNEFDTLSYHFG